MKLCTQREAIEAISYRENFRASALAGYSGAIGFGRLNDEEQERYQADRAEIDYAVYSYDTPIAWHTPAGWYQVAQRFSVTTSKHAGFVRRAISSTEVAA